MVRTQCTRCNQKIAVPDAFQGKRVRCPKCTRILSVPRVTSHSAPSYEVAPAPDSAPHGAAAQTDSAWTPRRVAGQADAGFAHTWIDYMRSSKAALFVSLLIVVFGIFWLLSEVNLLPPLHWLWTLGLAGTGVLTLLLGGINKQTLVVGPYLVICAGFSVLRQTGSIALKVEIPCLVIAFGVWLFIVIMCGYSLPDIVADD